MAKSRVALALFASVTILLSVAVATPAAAVQRASARVELPDLVGEPYNFANDALKALDLKPKPDRFVIIKSNWVVVSQKPAAGTMVKPGTKVALKVIKKSEIVSEGTALGYCRGMAKTDPAILFGIEFPSGQWVSSKRDLGWSIDVSVLLGTSDGGQAAMRVYCEIEGTDRKPKVITYEVTER